MQSEGESPVWGVTLIAAGGFAVAAMVACVLAVPWLGPGWWGWAVLFAAAAGGAFRFGWVEVCESTRYHRAMRLHRGRMWRAGARP